MGSYGSVFVCVAFHLPNKCPSGNVKKALIVSGVARNGEIKGEVVCVCPLPDKMYPGKGIGRTALWMTKLSSTLL